MLEFFYKQEERPMFVNAKPLDKTLHRNLKFSPIKGYQFAAQLPFSIISHREMIPASKYYPIVFPNSTDNKLPVLPHALLSIEEKKNAFVAVDGTWAAGYIPKHIRRYPFILGGTAKENQFAVMIDEAAPELQNEKGTPLFDETGEASEMLKKTVSFLENYKKELDLTQLMVRELEKFELLAPMNVTIQKGGSSKILKGFRTIDQKKLVKLDDATLAQWVRNGVMAFIHAHLVSMTNIKELAKLQGIAPAEKEMGV
jgi:hypothetical protein